MTLFGYARVPTIDQDLGIQVAALRAAGCQTIRLEKKSRACGAMPSRAYEPQVDVQGVDSTLQSQTFEVRPAVVLGRMAEIGRIADVAQISMVVTRHCVNRLDALQTPPDLFRRQNRYAHLCHGQAVCNLDLLIRCKRGLGSLDRCAPSQLHPPARCSALLPKNTLSSAASHVP